jgi:XTP/dITP diphosphohydrolase
MRKVVLMSNNLHKIEEFSHALKEFGIEVLSAKDIGVVDEPIEDGKTFEENALIKARHLAKYTSLPVIADDSGLEIHALDGFPGIFSARFMEGHSYIEKNNAVIKMLEDKNDKSAHFTCVIAFIYKGQEMTFRGECPGEIINELKGEHGFGYDPIFYIPSLSKTYAELEEHEKTAISHRGRALTIWKEYLKSNQL